MFDWLLVCAVVRCLIVKLARSVFVLFDCCVSAVCYVLRLIVPSMQADLCCLRMLC